MKEKSIAIGLATVMSLSPVGTALASELSPGNNRTELDNAAVSFNPELDIGTRYEKALSLAAVAGSPTSETEVNVETVKTILPKKIIVQIDKPYYLVTNPNVPGETNILRKNTTTPITIKGSTMVSLGLVSEILGAYVSTDNKSQVTTLIVDKKVSKFKIGSNSMSVTEDGNTKNVSLTVPPQLDKTKQLIVPVRAISEAFGTEVNYDAKSRSVLIGYSKAEMNNLFSNGTGANTEAAAEAIDIDATFKSFQYMAGGCFADAFNSQTFAIHDQKSSATVVFSDKDLEKVDNLIKNKSKLNAVQLKQEYINKSVINKITKSLKKDDFAYVLNGEAYVFNSNNLQNGYRSINKYDKNGKLSVIKNNLESTCYFSKIVWDKNIGIGVSDGSRITYKLNGNKFTELKDYVMLGTKEQRVRKTLIDLYNGKAFDQKNKVFNNPLNLDGKEVKQYLKTGSDEGLKSFQIVESEAATPFVMVTGGKWGLDELYSKAVEATVKRFDEIDPNIMKDIVDRNGMQTVTFDRIEDPIFPTHSGYGASFWNYDYGRVIYINNTYSKYLGKYDLDKLIEMIRPSIMEVLWVESKGQYSLDNLKFKNYFNDTEVYKATWLLAQVEKYKEKLDPILEYRYISNDAKNAINNYSSK